MNPFEIIGIIGLILTAISFMMKENKKLFMFNISGGVFLLTYAIYKNTIIFAILQSILISILIWRIINENKRKK